MATVFNRSKSEYTNIKNSLLKDKNLTFGARGLISLMLSRPDGWDFNMKEISSNTKESHYAVQKMMKELEECSYLFRAKRGIKGQKRKFEWLYFLSHTPFTEGELEDIRKEFLNDNKDLRQCENATIVNNDNRKLGSYINTENYSNTEREKKTEGHIKTIRQSIMKLKTLIENQFGKQLYPTDVDKITVFSNQHNVNPLEIYENSDFLRGLTNKKPTLNMWFNEETYKKMAQGGYVNFKKETPKEKETAVLSDENFEIMYNQYKDYGIEIFTGPKKKQFIKTCEVKGIQI